MNFLLVFIGGGLGSISRYALSVFFQKAGITAFPFATLLANLLACLILLLTLVFMKEKSNQISWLAPLVITGFCGGFSTFSTFSYETANLIHQANYLWAAGNVLISLTFGIALFWWIKA